MQPIERYGLVALLFLVVTTVAVVAWDGPGAPDNSSGTATEIANAPKSGRSNDLGVAPVQQGTSTNVDRKPAPTVDPRIEEQARLEAARREAARRAAEDAVVPAPLVDHASQAPNPFSGSTPVDAGAANDGAGLAAAPPVNGLVGQPSTIENTPVAPPTAGGLPNGPFVLTQKSLGDQLVQEYGKDFKLYGPNGLVAAFEQANPGLDTTRLAANAQLARPPAERIAAARKSNAVVVVDQGTRTTPPSNGVSNTGTNNGSNTGSNVAALPPGTRELDAVNVTPTVEVAARSHTVQAGETASSIAAKYLGDRNAYVAIARANPGVDINRIREGQVLVIPTSVDAARPGTVASNTNTPAANTPASAPANAANATKKATGPRIK